MCVRVRYQREGGEVRQQGDGATKQRKARKAKEVTEVQKDMCCVNVGACMGAKRDEKCKEGESKATQ